MAKFNVGGTPEDPFWRYKCPLMECHVVGRGGATRTCLDNLTDVSRQLGRFGVPTKWLIRYLSFELASNAGHDGHIVWLKGRHSAEMIHQQILKLCTLFVVCPKCNAPEILIETRKNRLHAKCEGCGFAGTLSDEASAHKLAKIIAKDPHPALAGGKKKGGEAASASMASRRGAGGKSAAGGGSRSGASSSVAAGNWQSTEVPQFLEEIAHDEQVIADAKAALKEQGADENAPADLESSVAAVLANEALSAAAKSSTLFRLLSKFEASHAALLKIALPKLLLPPDAFRLATAECFAACKASAVANAPFLSRIAERGPEQFLEAVGNLIADMGFNSRTGILVDVLYTADVISEDAILAWNARLEKKGADEPFASLKSGLALLVTWLRETVCSDDEEQQRQQAAAVVARASQAAAMLPSVDEDDDDEEDVEDDE